MFAWLVDFPVVPNMLHVLLGGRGLLVCLCSQFGVFARAWFCGLSVSVSFFRCRLAWFLGFVACQCVAVLGQ